MQTSKYTTLEHQNYKTIVTIAPLPPPPNGRNDFIFCLHINLQSKLPPLPSSPLHSLKGHIHRRILISTIATQQVKWLLELPFLAVVYVLWLGPGVQCVHTCGYLKRLMQSCVLMLCPHQSDTNIPVHVTHYCREQCTVTPYKDEVH